MFCFSDVFLPFFFSIAVKKPERDVGEIELCDTENWTITVGETDRKETDEREVSTNTKNRGQKVPSGRRGWRGGKESFLKKALFCC